MFIGIARRLVRRLEQLAQEHEQTTLVNGALASFLRDAYNMADASSYVANYDMRLRQLTIIAPSKTAASDLLLRSGELAASLRDNGVRISRLVIR